MPDAVLELVDVFAGYGRTTVLRGISFRAEHGEVVGIIGPNGHGKTTLLNAITGLAAVTAGTITHRADLLNGLRPETIAERGIVHIPQGDLVFPDMSVEENLIVGGYLLNSQDRCLKRLVEVYALFPKLKQRQTQIARTLSGGERRMLAIARGLMRTSDILMIDEPSLGLAPIVIDEIYEALAEIKRSGRSVILVEENPSRVELLADNACLIDNGQIAWAGSAASLKSADSILETYLGG